MARIFLAVIAAVTLTFFASVTHGQDDSHAEHAMPGEHSTAESGMHEGHGHGEGMEDYPEMPRQNFLMWLISSLGWKYTLLLPASALASFVLTGVLVVAGKGKTSGAAMAFLVAIPFLIGLFGMFDGMLASFMVLAHSMTTPKPSDVAVGISTSIVTPLVGMFLMVPSYLLATAGLFIKSLQGEPK